MVDKDMIFLLDKLERAAAAGWHERAWHWHNRVLAYAAGVQWQAAGEADQCRGIINLQNQGLYELYDAAMGGEPWRRVLKEREII